LTLSDYLDILALIEATLRSMGVWPLSPDEIIRILKSAGVSISRKTLYNWEVWGLIPCPVFRNSRVTDYPERAWEEAYATYCLLHGDYLDTSGLPANTCYFEKVQAPKIPPETVAAVRKYVAQRGGATRRQLDRVIEEVSWSSEDGSTEDYAELGKKVIELRVQQYEPYIGPGGEFTLPEELRIFLDFLADIWQGKREEARRLVKND